MIWCRTALKLERIIRATSAYRKSYLIFHVTEVTFSLFLGIIATILGIWQTEQIYRYPTTDGCYQPCHPHHVGRQTIKQHAR